MRPTENIEGFIRKRKLHIATSADADKRILNDSFAAMETAKAKLTGSWRNRWTMVWASKVRRLAAAAVIILLIGFVIVHQVSRRQTDGQAVMEAAKSPAEMLTFVSLTMAYRKGGIDALERQCEQAVELLGPRREDLSIGELLEELNSNGMNSERTEL